MWNQHAPSGRAWTALALTLLMGGCAASSEPKASDEGLMERTMRGVSSALETTKETVTSTVGRIVKEQREGWMEMREKDRAAAAAKPEGGPARRTQQAAAPPDRFPSQRPSSGEQDLGSPGRPAPRNPESRGRDIALLPRVPQTPDQLRARMAEIDKALALEKDPAQRERLSAERERLAQVLQASLEEESLIREMEQLRARLRRLQSRLLEIQRPRP